MKDVYAVKSRWMFAINILFLNNLEGTGQSFSNTDDLPYQMFRSLKSQEDERWDFCMRADRLLRASMVWFLAASTGPLQSQTTQCMLLHALLKPRFNAQYRYFFRSAFYLLFPAVVGRTVLLITRSPFNLDAEL